MTRTRKAETVTTTGRFKRGKEADSIGGGDRLPQWVLFYCKSVGRVLRHRLAFFRLRVMVRRAEKGRM